MNNYYAVVAQTNEYQYWVTADTEEYVLNFLLPVLDPSALPAEASLCHGPVQVDVQVMSLTDEHGTAIPVPPVAIQPLQDTSPTNTAPATTKLVYRATVRQQQFVMYYIIAADIPSMLALLAQTNPSVSTLPDGVTVSAKLQGSTVRTVECQRQDGSYLRLLLPW